MQVMSEVKPSYASEVQRALVALGFSESERGLGRGLNTFSLWVDQLQVLPNVSEELKATWTQFMISWFGTKESYRGKEQIEHAAESAWHAITMQLRYFPPRARKEYGDDQSYAEEWTELSEWRTAAKQRGWSTPLDMRGRSATDDAELIAWRAAATLHGVTAPKQLESMVGFDFVQFTELQEWRAAAKANEFDSLRSKVGDTSTQLQLSERKWQLATGCMTATGAGELIKSFRAANVDLQSKLDELSAKLHERDQDLLTANSEIDRVKSAAHTLGLVFDDTKELDRVRTENRALRAEIVGKVLSAHPDCARLTTELAKTRAELQTKQREVADHSIMWKRINTTIGLSQGSVIDIVQWIEDAQKKLANAVIPLPKPEKVEAGQKWARLVEVIEQIPDEPDYVRLSSFGTMRASHLFDGWTYLGK
jgi:hypothetical protein